MAESWLEIGDEELDAQEVQRRIEARLSRREVEGLPACPELDADLDLTADRPSAQEDPSAAISRWLQDCDLVPAFYQIDWRVPILGPIHAAIRRVINAEIRRFLLPSLVKQSHLNRAVLLSLQELERENARLRGEVEQLRQSATEPGRDREPDR